MKLIFKKSLTFLLFSFVFVIAFFSAGPLKVEAVLTANVAKADGVSPLNLTARKTVAFTATPSEKASACSLFRGTGADMVFINSVTGPFSASLPVDVGTDVPPVGSTTYTIECEKSETYTWSTGTWSACTTTGTNACSGSWTTESGGACDGPVGAGNQIDPQKCSGIINKAVCISAWSDGCRWDNTGYAITTNQCSTATTSSACTSLNAACSWSTATTSQTTTVKCVNSSGVTVEDSFCTGTKPASSRSCIMDSCATLPIGSSGPYASCFVSNTKVKLANGNIKNIQDVKIGDILIGEKTNNTVLGFHQPKLGDKKLYSFNGGEYFVTAEHPFMTTEGWKAFDPELAMQEHRLNIKIGQLSIGDTLVTEKGNVLLKKVSTKSDKADTQLYNFILDGDHTYYADGYLVHNKAECLDGVANGGCGTRSTCINGTGYTTPTLQESGGNGTCSLVCTKPGAVTTGGNCSYSGTDSGKTETYCGEDYELHCRVPLGVNDCVIDDTVIPINPAVPGASVWYCHLGSFIKQSNTTCDNENFPDGYMWGQTRVCTTLTPSSDDCEKGPITAPSTANCIYAKYDRHYICTD